MEKRTPRYIQAQRLRKISGGLRLILETQLEVRCRAKAALVRLKHAKFIFFLWGAYISLETKVWIFAQQIIQASFLLQ